jgi:hypothetical protein
VTDDGPDPVTLRPIVKWALVDGLTRNVIDTEGHADGNSVSSEQITKLALYLREWPKGVNGVCVILNGQCDRFSQGIKDIFQWAYDTFAVKEVLDHICIVFTHWYDWIPPPNREKKCMAYRARVQQFLGQISGVATVPVIPMFFVDSLSDTSAETRENVVQFHSWLVSRRPLSTVDVHEAPLRDEIEDEKVMKRFKCHLFTGPPDDESRVTIYEDLVRQRITPHNGDPVRFDEWKVLRTYEEPAGRRTTTRHSVTHEIEDKIVEHHRAHTFVKKLTFSGRPHTHFQIMRKKWVEQWSVTTDFDGTMTETEPERIGDVIEWMAESGRERGWTEGYHRVLS